MRVQGAKAHLIKVLEFINAMKADDTQRLDKTKRQLIELADICKQIVAGIQEIANVNFELDKSDISTYNNDLYAMFDELRSEIEQLKSQRNVGIVETEHTKNVSVSVKYDESVRTRYTSIQCAEIVNQFKESLHHNADIDYGVDAANKCSSMLWKWFQARYQTPYNQSEAFRYNVSDIKKYVHAIVITFGYYYEQNDMDGFSEMFDKWETLLSTSKKSNHYVVPYEVAVIGKNMKSEHSTFTAAVIWHMFTQNGLSEICHDDEDSAYLSHEELLERLFVINPEIEDWFEDYLSRNEVVV